MEFDMICVTKRSCIRHEKKIISKKVIVENEIVKKRDFLD